MRTHPSLNSAFILIPVTHQGGPPYLQPPCSPHPPSKLGLILISTTHLEGFVTVLHGWHTCKHLAEYSKIALVSSCYSRCFQDHILPWGHTQTQLFCTCCIATHLHGSSYVFLSAVSTCRCGHQLGLSTVSTIITVAEVPVGVVQWHQMQKRSARPLFLW